MCLCVCVSVLMDDWMTLHLERSALIELVGFHCVWFSSRDEAFILRLSFTRGPFVCVVCWRRVRAAKWDNRVPWSTTVRRGCSHRKGGTAEGLQHVWILGSLSGNKYFCVRV